MSSKHPYLKLAAGIAFLVLSVSAFSQEVSVGSVSVPGGDPASVDVTYTAPMGSDIVLVQLDILYDETQLGAPDLSSCTGAAPNGGSTFCSNPSAGVVRIINEDPFNNPLASGVIGTVSWNTGTVPADPGIYPLAVSGLLYVDSGASPVAGTSSDGQITVQAPPNGFYGSSPAPGSELNLGEAVVNSLASPIQTLTVSNSSADDFNISGFSSGAPELTLPAGSFVVPGSGSVDFDGVTEDAVACTPSAVGTNSGSFAVAHDAAGGPTTPVSYDFTCKGLAPNVAVSPTMLMLNGSIGGTAPTATFDISNLDTIEETTSDAQNVQLAESGDTEISITDGLTDNVLIVDEIDSVEVSCSTGTATDYSKTITVSWNDPVTGGTAMQDVTVNCSIANVAPGYTSDPAVPGPLAFGQIANGDTSAPQTIDIGNEGSVGTGAGAELEITGAVLSDTTNYSFAPDPFTATLAADAPNGTASVDVTCGPQSIGNFPATLTVNTNDGDQVYNLTCEGTSNAGFAVSPAGALDGTLNIGSVPPNTLTSGSMTISNTGTDPLEVDCTLTDNNMGVIAFNPVPAFPVTIPPDLTLTFQGTPPGIGTFSETLDCTVTDPSVTAAPDPDTFSTTIAVTGRPLVIPTMSRWGLVVMSLMLLLVAGFAGRRMMA